MQQLTHRERLKATLAGEETDRIPLSIWYHIPQLDQDPIALAEEQIRIALKYDFDFIKLCPFGNYGAVDYGLSCTYFCTPDQPVLERKFRTLSAAEWESLEVLPAYYGTYGKVLQTAAAAKRLLKAQGLDIPVIQTIFNPLTTARKLVGPTIREDMREHPEAVKAGLQAITDTTINFIRAHIDLGIDGFFYATQTAQESFIPRDLHDEFAEPFDRRVAEAYNQQTWFNVLHIHGEKTYFDVVADYPGEVVNFHDFHGDPDIAGARLLTDKTLLCGINERDLFGNPAVGAEEITISVRNAVREGGARRLIIGPGCVANPLSPEQHFYAARLGTEFPVT